MPLSNYLTLTIIACIFLALAGLYRPLRARISAKRNHSFKPYLFYPLFIGFIGVVLASPAIINLFVNVEEFTAGFTVFYPFMGAATGLLAGGLYVLGYEGKAPYKPEALLILPLLAAVICVGFSYAAAL